MNNKNLNTSVLPESCQDFLNRGIIVVCTFVYVYVNMCMCVHSDLPTYEKIYEGDREWGDMSSWVYIQIVCDYTVYPR